MLILPMTSVLIMIVQYVLGWDFTKEFDDIYQNSVNLWD